MSTNASGGTGPDFLADDPAGKGVDHKGDVDKPGPSEDAGEGDYPQRVGPADLERAADPVERARCLRVADGGNRRLPAPYACQAHVAHQPFHCTLGDCHPFAVQLMPDLAGTLETEANFVGLHRELPREGHKFPLRSGPCLSHVRPAGLKVTWSDRHGVIDCNPSLAFS